MKKILLLCFCSLCLLSCTKEQDIYTRKNCTTDCVWIKGRTIDTITNKGANRKVLVKYTNSSSFLRFEETMGVINSNINGEFAVEIPAFGHFSDLDFYAIENGFIAYRIYDIHKNSNDSIFIRQ